MRKLADLSLLPSLTGLPERVLFIGVAGAISTAVVSVAASQIFLAAALAAAVLLWRERGRDAFCWPVCAWPLTVFCLWTLCTIILSGRVYPSVLELKKFYLYSIVFLAPAALRAKGAATRIYAAIFIFSVVSCLKGISQFISNPQRSLVDRISGFMSQWMTYSGLLMLALVGLSAFAVCQGMRKSLWSLPLGLLLIVPLLLSETRNAWAGAVAGIFVVVLLRRPRAVPFLLITVLAVYLISPLNLKKRLRSGFDPEDPNTRNRVELFQTSLRLIRENPWLGVGPKNVAQEALKYRGTQEFPDWLYQHMHNNFLQIAAERGIPGLLIWSWFMGSLGWGAWRGFRQAGGLSAAGESADNEALVTSTAALGAWAALLVAGLFEYNFGDSEVLTLFLFMSAAPFSSLIVQIPTSHRAEK
jgi:O-antigen ligase